MKSEGSPVPSRYLRSHRPSQAGSQCEAVAGTSGAADEAGSVSEVERVVGPSPADPWEFLSPVDVLANLPKDFYEQLESKKWNERKEPLDNLIVELKDQRLDPKAQYGEIVSVLKKV